MKDAFPRFLATTLSVLFVLFLLPGVAAAHHGASAHFDLDRQIEISGTVVRFERINPHAFLFVSVPGKSGSPDVWQCELNGTSQLARLGINTDTFRPGDAVRIEANPGKRDPHACLFIAAHFADGRTITARPDLGSTPVPVEVDTSIAGIWLPQFAGPGAPLPPNAPNAPFNPLNFLTDSGKVAHAKYDPIRDDPVRKCSPVNPDRLWGEPSYPLEIRKEDNAIVIRYEFMDAERTVHLNAAAHATKAHRTILGDSIGHFDGDVLLIDTTTFSPGVIVQYGQDSSGKVAGVLHPDAYHVNERVAVNPQTGRLEVSATQEDSKYFTRPFPARNFVYARRPDLKLEKFNCVPDKDLNH